MTVHSRDALHVLLQNQQCKRFSTSENTFQSFGNLQPHEENQDVSQHRVSATASMLSQLSFLDPDNAAANLGGHDELVINDVVRSEAHSEQR